MRRSPLTRQLALALAALLVTSCLTVQTRQRPITDVGGGADGHGGIALKVFADDDALKASARRERDGRAVGGAEGGKGRREEGRK